MIEKFLQHTVIKALVKPELIRSIITDRPGAYVTGSFVIGGATVASDIDIVIPLDNPISDQVLEQDAKCFGGAVIYSQYNNGRKLFIPGLTPINILQLHPLDYAAFLFATETMCSAPVITDRNARHRCFEELCHAYKAFINPTCVNLDGMHTVIDRNVFMYMAHRIDWENFYARQLPEV